MYHAHYDHYDIDDGYGANESARAVANLKALRSCKEPCGGWWLSPFDTWERCPCCPDMGHPEDEIYDDIDTCIGNANVCPCPECDSIRIDMMVEDHLADMNKNLCPACQGPIFSGYSDQHGDFDYCDCDA